MNKQTFVIILILIIAGYAFAGMKDHDVDAPFTGVKRKLMTAFNSDSGAGSVTVKAGSVKCLIPKKLCVSVQYLVKDKKVGNGAAFAVSLPNKSFTARVKAGREFTVKLDGESYTLKFDSVSVADDSATFSVQKGGDENDES